MLKKIIIGFLAGIVSGLFTSGGGLILIPTFVHLLNLNEKEARATSLFCVLPFCLITAIEYNKSSYIDWTIGIKCAIGGIFGGIIGTKFLKMFSNNVLKILFTIFLIYVSIRMLIG